MTKIRNAIVSEDCYGYAGPVGDGRRGSRKSPESFSGASPPGLFQPHYSICVCMGKMKTFLGKVIFTVGIAFMLAVSVVALTGCDTTLEQTQEPAIDGVSTANGDLEFGEINTEWTQAEVNTRVRIAMNFLAAQAKDIGDQYYALRNAIAPTLNPYNEWEIRAQMGFADNVRGEESTLYSAFSSRTCNNKGVTNNAVTNIEDRILGMRTIGETPDSIVGPIMAFRLANYMHMRKHASSEEQAANQAELERLAGIIQEYCGYYVPTNNIETTIRILKAQMPNAMPRYTGPPAHDGVFIRQFEDYSQFDGWTEDLKTLGYDLTNIPLRNLQIIDNFKPEQALKIREDIQMDIKDPYGNRTGTIEHDGTRKDIYGSRTDRIDDYRR